MPRRERDPQRPAAPAWLAGVLAGVLASVLVGACTREPVAATSSGTRSVTAAEADSDIDFGPAPSFRLTERSGRTITDADLAGSVWVVNFFFSTCTGPCPLVTANMRRLQDELEGTGVRLLSITVDPETDDAATLAAYADAFTADPERWWFATGPEEHVMEVAVQGFKQAVQRAELEAAVSGDALTHGTRLAVVDRHGRIRGYYEGAEEAARAWAAARARWLDAH